MFATLGDEKSRLFIRVFKEGVGTNCETRCAKNRVRIGVVRREKILAVAQGTSGVDSMHDCVCVRDAK